MKRICYTLLFLFLSFSSFADEKDLEVEKKKCEGEFTKICANSNALECIPQKFDKFSKTCRKVLAFKMAKKEMGKRQACSDELDSICEKKEEGETPTACYLRNKSKFKKYCESVLNAEFGLPELDGLGKSSKMEKNSKLKQGVMDHCLEDIAKFCPVDLKRIALGGKKMMADYQSCIHKNIKKFNSRCQKVMSPKRSDVNEGDKRIIFGKKN